MLTPTIEASYRRRWLVLAVLCLSVLLTVVSNMALNVALPTLGRQLHAGTSSLAWVVDTYVLCFAGLLLPAGAIGDRFGRKGALQCGLVIYIAAAVCGAYAPGVGSLIAARAVMGVGAALVMPGTLSILAAVFPPVERPKAITIWASVAGGSVALSIAWSGAMLEHFWWGAIFLGMAAVAVLALIAGLFLLPTSRHPQEGRFDVVGAALSVVGVTGLLYGFIQAPDDGWGATPILVAFAIGITGLIVFVGRERHVTHPMLDIGFFAERRFSLGCLSIAAAYLALFGMYFVFTQYLQLVRGYSPLAAGLYALPTGLAQLAVANLVKPFVARHGIRPVLTAGLIASTAGLLVLATSGTSSPIWAAELGLALLGVGIGLTMPPATGAIMSSLPPRKAGVGSAVNDLVRELGGAFGIGVLGTITLSRYRSQLAPTLTHQTPAIVEQAKTGLTQALSTLGGPNSAAGTAARNAYSSGLDLATLAGAILVAAAAVTVYLALPATRPAPTSTPQVPDPARTTAGH
jgi:EmrB/QacA subfamily drug resistance transporter